LIPIKGTHVKVYLRNGAVEEGFVEEWNKDNVILKSLIDSTITILHKPLDDIFLTKIIESKDKQPVFVDEEIKPKKYIRDSRLRAMHLAELHKIKAEEERKRAREALTTFKLSDNIRENTQYAEPIHVAKSIYNNTKKKNR